jgi:hydrogenase nickel incorporation protein HypB
MLLSKMDLLPYLDFDLEKCLASARRVSTDIRVCPLSTKSGAGMAGWYAGCKGRDRPANCRYIK